MILLHLLPLGCGTNKHSKKSGLLSFIIFSNCKYHRNGYRENKITSIAFASRAAVKRAGKTINVAHSFLMSHIQTALISVVNRSFRTFRFYFVSIFSVGFCFIKFFVSSDPELKR